MSDPPVQEKNDLETQDLEKLARRYLDLWQDQLEGLAADPEVAETIARTLQLMNAGAAQMTAQMTSHMTAHMTSQAPNVSGARFGEDMQDHGAKPGSPSGSAGGPAPGTSAAAPSHGDSDHHVAELLGRIGALEERIAALEAEPDGGGGALKKRSKRRRA